MEPTLANVKRRFNKFMQHYTIKCETRHDDVRSLND